MSQTNKAPARKERAVGLGTDTSLAAQKPGLFVVTKLGAGMGHNV